MRKNLSDTIKILMCIIAPGVVIGGVVRVATLQTENIQHRYLTKSEIKNNFLMVKTHPGTITISWVDKIEKYCTLAGSNACAEIDNNTCHIYLPSKMTIGALPDDPLSAHWISSDDDELITHEILHCFVENWHQTWDQEYQRQR